MDNFEDGQTHKVFNQPAVLEDYNLFESNSVLQYWSAKFSKTLDKKRLSSFGQNCGSELLDSGYLANKHVPEFQSHDRTGLRIDQVNYHPSYHQLMSHAIEAGHVFLPWRGSDSACHATRGAMAYMHNYADPGSGCPLTMTFAAVPVIASTNALKSHWLPKLLSGVYDPRNVPWFEKQGVTIGMAMTEKQGGSDVRANTTFASPLNTSGPEQLYKLVGHKWFCSAPMCDAFLVLAQTKGGLSCFLVPRWREDGTKNPIHIQRLKDKLGNRSNASAEIEFHGAHGWLIGEEGRGITCIMQMVALTRYDCMIGSAALMGQSIDIALYHCSQRQVFGARLNEQPLMQNVLADLALEAEAAMAISFRIAHALNQHANERETALIRGATAIGKYWNCKRAVQHTYESMECLGGIGYINDCPVNRAFRESPVNAIWEGSGNVQCLDLLRVVQKEPDAMDAIRSEILGATGFATQLDNAITKLDNLLVKTGDTVYEARRIIEQLALCWQASTLVQYGEQFIAEGFVASRFDIDRHSQYGCMPSDIDCASIIERHTPRL